MQFGKVENPGEVDFTIPPDHPGSAAALAKGQTGLKEVYVGSTSWSRSELKGFYPRGTKDELTYYGQQFNSIEFNATFYNNYPPEQIERWRDKTPKDFRFFPKVHRFISHVKWLNEADRPVEEFCHSVRAFEDRLGMAFMQMHNNFGPNHEERLRAFLDYWPKDVPLAVELRHTDWFNQPEVAERLYALMERHQVANIIVDTAGRRDLMHMRLTSPVAFVRFVGAVHPCDADRIREWVARIQSWKQQGLEKLYFFVHQNMEKESPLLIYQFMEAFNKAFELQLRQPKQQTLSLF